MSHDPPQDAVKRSDSEVVLQLVQRERLYQEKLAKLKDIIVEKERMIRDLKGLLKMHAARPP